MKREWLKEMGLADEQIEQIMKENGKDIEGIKAEAATKEADLATANNTISELQSAVKKFDGVDVDALKKSVADLQTKYDSDMSAARLENAVVLALAGQKAKNPKLAKNALDMTKIKLDGEKLLGFEDQIKGLRETDGYLFDSAETKPAGATVSTGAEHGKPVGGTEKSLQQEIQDKLYGLNKEG